ncbi:MAG TPA: CotS family spore coat protein [Firmicutes bacterium]|nr:CotS family spore coat protein [Bacillota bacterium]
MNVPDVQRVSGLPGLPPDPGAPWGLAVTEVEPVRGVYRLRSGGEQYCLKPTALSRREITFVAAVLDHLKAVGLPGAPQLLRTVAGEPVARLGRRRFQLLRWQEGREADFLRPGEAEQAAVALAQLHLAGLGFVPPFPRFRVLFGRWPAILTRKRAELACFAEQAATVPRPTAFEREYARLAPAWLAAADEALAELAASPYRELSAAARRRGGICHHDLAHHNVLLTPEGPVLVDFDYALADLGLHDLANLLRRLLRLVEWDPAPGRACLAAYREIAGGHPGETAVLLPLLRFPEEAWLTGRQYYVERLPWPEERFLEQLARKGDTSPARRACLAELAGPGGAGKDG